MENRFLNPLLKLLIIDLDRSISTCVGALKLPLSRPVWPCEGEDEDVEVDESVLWRDVGVE